MRVPTGLLDPALHKVLGSGGLLADSAGIVLHSWGHLCSCCPVGQRPPLHFPLLNATLSRVLETGAEQFSSNLEGPLSDLMVWAGSLPLADQPPGIIAVFFHNRPVQELIRENDAIIDGSSDGLFVCDGEGTILRVNPASLRINQAPLEKLVGRPYLEAASAGLLILPSAALEAIKLRKPVSLLQENRYGRKLISSATPVFASDGNLIRVVVSERDITEIDRLEQELEKQQAIGHQYRDQVLELQQRQLAQLPLIAESPCMVKTLQQALKLSEVDSTVLLLGESGVGKGLIADLIHQNSARSQQPIIKLNCGAIPETLIEAELFGYEKGAFTGAVSNKPGHLELADGGTLFLDEIAELPPQSQVKLLRFMEDGQVTRLGGTRSKKIDVRILAATHQDLEQMIADRRFRADLFYRLSVIPLAIPPLRERKECLLPLINHYIALFATRSGKKRQLSPAALDLLCGYGYPGNVRELMNICERLVIMADAETIDIKDLPASLLNSSTSAAGIFAPDWPVSMSMEQILESVERHVLLKTARRFKKQRDIALELGMSQPTVARKLQKYGITHHYDGLD